MSYFSETTRLSLRTERFIGPRVKYINCIQQHRKTSPNNITHPHIMPLLTRGEEVSMSKKILTILKKEAHKTGDRTLYESFHIATVERFGAKAESRKTHDKENGGGAEIAISNDPTSDTSAVDLALKIVEATYRFHVDKLVRSGDEDRHMRTHEFLFRILTHEFDCDFDPQYRYEEDGTWLGFIEKELSFHIGTTL